MKIPRNKILNALHNSNKPFKEKGFHLDSSATVIKLNSLLQKVNKLLFLDDPNFKDFYIRAYLMSLIYNTKLKNLFDEVSDFETLSINNFEILQPEIRGAEVIVTKGDVYKVTALENKLPILHQFQIELTNGSENALIRYGNQIEYTPCSIMPYNMGNRNGYIADIAFQYTSCPLRNKLYIEKYRIENGEQVLNIDEDNKFPLIIYFHQPINFPFEFLINGQRLDDNEHIVELLNKHDLFEMYIVSNNTIEKTSIIIAAYVIEYYSILADSY